MLYLSFMCNPSILHVHEVLPFLENDSFEQCFRIMCNPSILNVHEVLPFLENDSFEQCFRIAVYFV